MAYDQSVTVTFGEMDPMTSGPKTYAKYEATGDLGRMMLRRMMMDEIAQSQSSDPLKVGDVITMGDYPNAGSYRLTITRVLSWPERSEDGHVLNRSGRRKKRSNRG